MIRLVAAMYLRVSAWIYMYVQPLLLPMLRQLGLSNLFLLLGQMCVTVRSDVVDEHARVITNEESFSVSESG
jgi:hypothetical protein